MSEEIILPKLSDIENANSNLEYYIRDICIEFFNKGIEFQKQKEQEKI